MAKRYSVEAGDGTGTTDSATHGGGNPVHHFVDAGRTLGKVRQYGGFANGSTTYLVVDNGPFRRLPPWLGSARLPEEAEYRRAVEGAFAKLNPAPEPDPLTESIWGE